MKRRKVECVGVSLVPGVVVELHNHPCGCCGRRNSDYVIAGECLMCGEPGAVVGDDDTGKAVYCVACDCVSLVVWCDERGSNVPQNGERGSVAAKRPSGVM